ncbi:nitroreductase family deazaflavin-dependent oxidoreductase [Microbacterium schleiferi]|jgi:deazaflavin-dependent oxidoreductase (nitroreductase family)|uniref:Nitroreductase family deazaflavin-dependent oxidoreductase n=1 Tax=Microbacterium schleiferi TaxID=69362 RepID=A0A7S8RGI4_9MICO|nr:nitroreductase/quinone reductase family protein [Microbacterium schleiferi]QPE04421.1 nitroreductase family deazaflavin-dependent oxidoreductase [Microbacterium schleiferi]
MTRATGIVLTALGVLAAVLTAAFATLVVLLRRRDKRFIRRFTRLQRDVLNPNVLKTAGTPGQRTAVLETVGRRSGTPYETPISPVPDAEGWCVALVYGPETAWAKNAVAAGEAVLRIDGRRHRVDQLEIVPIGETALAADQAGLMSLFRVEHAVRMRDAGVIDPEPTAPA